MQHGLRRGLSEFVIAFLLSVRQSPTMGRHTRWAPHMPTWSLLLPLRETWPAPPPQRGSCSRNRKEAFGHAIRRKLFARTGGCALGDIIRVLPKHAWTRRYRRAGEI